MIYGSVCTGVTADHLAWGSLGWRTAWVSEIGRFPNAVLSHRLPGVPNLGDLTKIQARQCEPIDVLMGGTPCQSFSVAGLRRGLDDPNGKLVFGYLRLVDVLKPRWIVWENVPGVLSIDNGRVFGAFLGALGQLGYGWAYRVLNAQYWGVPQRRRRVFVVGHLGGWQRPTAVLFEPESLRGYPSPGGDSETPVAALTSRGVGTCGADDNQAQAGHLVAQAVGTQGRSSPRGSNLVAGVPLGEQGPSDRPLLAKGNGGYRGDLETETLIACTLPASDGGPSSGMHPVIPVAFGWNKSASQTMQVGDTTDAIQAASSSQPAALTYQGVRRLTPRECERLQGMPDDWTLVPYGPRRRKARGRPRMAKDGPRYTAIGNSIAVPVLRWIGERIQMVDAL